MTIYSGFSQWKWWFSIVMLVYQRVVELCWIRLTLFCFVIFPHLGQSHAGGLRGSSEVLNIQFEILWGGETFFEYLNHTAGMKWTNQPLILHDQIFLLNMSRHVRAESLWTVTSPRWLHIFTQGDFPTSASSPMQSGAALGVTAVGAAIVASTRKTKAQKGIKGLKASTQDVLFKGGAGSVDGGMGAGSFGGSKSTSSSSATVSSTDLGVQAPIGYWDPLGLNANADAATFRRRRAVEIKHGRVAMFATMGYIVPEYYKFPGAINFFNFWRTTCQPHIMISYDIILWRILTS